MVWTADSFQSRAWSSLRKHWPDVSLLTKTAGYEERLTMHPTAFQQAKPSPPPRACCNASLNSNGPSPIWYTLARNMRRSSHEQTLHSAWERIDIWQSPWPPACDLRRRAIWREEDEPVTCLSKHRQQSVLWHSLLPKACSAAPGFLPGYSGPPYACHR